MPLKYFNTIEVTAKMKNALKADSMANFYRQSAKAILSSAKQEMLAEFDNHIVTKELEEVNTPYEGSTLVNGGSLRAFLGFYSGDDPAGKLRAYLENFTHLSESRPQIEERPKSVVFHFDVEVPTVQDIYEDPTFETPDQWDSQGWVEIVENGTNTAINFIFALSAEMSKKFKRSRSKWGLQNVEYEGDATFTPRLYVTEILEHFKRNLS